MHLTELFLGMSSTMVLWLQPGPWNRKSCCGQDKLLASSAVQHTMWPALRSWDSLVQIFCFPHEAGPPHLSGVCKA